MRRIMLSALLALAAVLALCPPAEAQPSNNCREIQNVTFQCTVGQCTMSIFIRRCKNLTTSPWNCYSCWDTLQCCGSEVCNAQQVGECDNSFPLGLLRDLEKMVGVQAARMYVPDCSGNFLSLPRFLALRTEKENASPTERQPAHPEAKRTAGG